MTEIEPREPPRQVWHFFLLAAAVIVITASHLVSARPLMISSFNNVAPAGDLPATVTDVPDDWSALIQRRVWKPPFAAMLGHHADARRIRLGWVVRGWSFMTLPLFARRQSDLAAFRETPYGYALFGLSTEQLRQVDAAGATPWFPWWRFTWGWLVLAAVAGFGWAELRWQARRRAMLGLI